MIRKIQHLWLFYAPLWLWVPVNRLRKQLAKVGYRLGRKAPCPEVIARERRHREGYTIARCIYYSGHPGRCRWAEETR